MLSRRLNLRSLYLGPLLRVLREESTELETLQFGENWEEDNFLGAFANNPTQTLVLLIHFDVDPERIWSLLVHQLQSLREDGFLTYFNGSSIVQGPITIVATGNAPFHRILESGTFRDIFYDAPLSELSLLHSGSHFQNHNYTAENSYYTSADFTTAVGVVGFNGFTEHQLSIVRNQVHMAHEHGLKLRYWNTPTWSRKLQNYVLRILLREGVDSVTADGFKERF
ncbi:uncharacterized protein N7511_004765 [Penicillium nucicola]|uniref:uncharacterized protein n=1 Tax=Penicillium nucicola TaxID=1850975 RepID=UPI00254596BE|nr:uncharacterized protein N7511_004765 [Penicillium nucicola]KAJ5767149.1 hypothetical protein N7511_004765 [Penicillium nucicola]